MNEADSDELMWGEASHTQSKKNVEKKLSTMNVTRDFKPSPQSYTTETVFRPQLLTKRENSQAPASTSNSNSLGKTFHSPRFQWMNKP